MIVYLGRVGAGEDLSWFGPQLQAARVRAGSARMGGESSCWATVGIKGVSSYSKQYLKMTQMSLERALQSRTPDLWNHYSSRVVDRLCGYGMTQAGQRMTKIAAMARQQFGNGWASDREYLVLIFFDLWARRDLLEEFSVRDSVLMQGSPAARQMRLQVGLAPVLGQLSGAPGWPMLEAHSLAPQMQTGGASDLADGGDALGVSGYGRCGAAEWPAQTTRATGWADGAGGGSAGRKVRFLLF